MSNSKPEVKIICDSICDGKRITTFQLRYWRPLLAETNTHRIFSRNAESSRAKSFEARCADVAYNPYLPDHWNAEQPGMVGGEEFDAGTKTLINDTINQLALHTVEVLKNLDQEVWKKTGKSIHKQYLNRYLEPFVTVSQLVTSTDWNNFFRLRMASDAQPELRDVATEMFYALQESIPVERVQHLPYITEEEKKEYSIEQATKISVARCARVSYKPYDGHIRLEKDLELYDRLLNCGHMSPFEHIAIACKGHWYNLDGWKSYRYELEHHSDGGSASSK